MSRPRIQITLIDQKGTKGCHRGHKIGDSYDFDTERGNLCPMAMHVAFPYVDILRYGGEIPGSFRQGKRRQRNRRGVRRNPRYVEAKRRYQVKYVRDAR